MTKTPILAEVLLPTTELRNDLPFFTKTLGMRLENIFPADDPSVASFSGHGLRIRIEKGADVPPGHIRILTDDVDGFADGKRELNAPNGTRVTIIPLTPQVEHITTQHEFAVRRLTDEAPWVIGRAGMHYRDLIPSRLGGSIIASHIRIPDGGPVPDMVHYHTVGFQLIFCYRGWVDVLYEDQGDVIRLHAGDCVTQPPGIRHRVVEASPNIEVIEIGVPAEHITTIDHDFTLPNGTGDPAREWDGQTFVHHIKERAVWAPAHIPGFTARDTGITAGTKGIAGIQVLRRAEGASSAFSHTADIHFTFVMEGTMTLHAEGQQDRTLEAGDGFVIPPEMVVSYTDASEDIELLEVALRGDFNTVLA
ncbi:cupin domain-containing protein [Sulfitobacter guttiformis]|uniref:Quercetin dioxygenase-like cupin family protein n=1 Tax=Sulfitobacter guttiformis TaxID=74349 RepID=A0A420DRQ0_9RHOB|nr:cupin domain-containing protein [Sulfitobacter guttiformis]KIN74207.1 Cupin domain protein [Sulfitobacter guttiformis KCTC 32187]RKE96819.1 quercetin dioxygenase-like cupin family protein [Sulfitobacter guttiformis]